MTVNARLWNFSARRRLRLAAPGPGVERPVTPADRPLDSLGRRSVGGQHFLVLAVLICLLLPCAVSFEMLGYQSSGWAWLGALAAAFATIATATAGPTLPVVLWLPWSALVTAYSLAGFANAYQSTAQILCPVVVGIAASTLRPRPAQIEGLVRAMRWAGVAFLGIIVFLRLPMLLLGRLPNVTGLAAEAISALVFQAFFLCAFIMERKRVDLLLFLSFAAVPLVTVTRGPMLASLALVMLTVAPLSLAKRGLILGVAVILSIGAFYTERVQKKMFWSGSGDLTDLSWDNPNLITSGRAAFWKLLSPGIQEKPWFGHGGNADATTLTEAGERLYLPHNDWLRVAYNYGYVGLGFYLLAMGGQVAHGLGVARRAPPRVKLLFYAGLSTFAPYWAVMATDNVLIYAQFFGNLHFLILGLAYGASAAARESTDGAAPVHRTQSWTMRSRNALRAVARDTGSVRRRNMQAPAVSQGSPSSAKSVPSVGSSR